MSNNTEKNKTAIVKKYANRRLYDTETSAYITLEDLCTRVKSGDDFVVQDAKTGTDLTNQVLTQIILEQEIKGFNLLPSSFLRSVIRLHDDNEITGTLQNYLNASMTSFNNNKEQMESIFGKAIGDIPQMGQFEEMTRKNVAMFEKTMSMFNPFAGAFSNDEPAPKEEQPKEDRPKAKKAKRS